MHEASPTIKRCLCLLQLLPTKGVFTFLTLTDGLTQFSFLVSVFYKLCLDKSHTEECPTKHLNPSSHSTTTEVDWTPGKWLEWEKKIGSGNKKKECPRSQTCPYNDWKSALTAVWTVVVTPRCQAQIQCTIKPRSSHLQEQGLNHTQHSSPSVVLWLIKKNCLKYIKCF